MYCLTTIDSFRQPHERFIPKGYLDDYAFKLRMAFGWDANTFRVETVEEAAQRRVEEERVRVEEERLRVEEERRRQEEESRRKTKKGQKRGRRK